jgi:hypothetical protein
MLSLLGVVLPVFALLAAGYGARRFGLVGDRTGDGLSDFVFTLAVPCLLFRTLARADLPTVAPWGYWMSYFIGVVVVWTLAMLLARRVFARTGAAAVACGFASAQSNTVLVGIPVILQAFGDAAAVPIALLLAVHLPLTMTAATLLAEGRRASAAAILFKLATHPILVGIMLGLLARPVAGALPAPVWSTINLLAGAAIPCALIGLGIALHRYGLSGGVALPVTLSALKLGLHPAIVFVLATFVFAMPPVWAAVAVLFAACPCGINAYLFAERYRDGMAETSSALALSTLAAVFTLMGWLALVGVGG